MGLKFCESCGGIVRIQKIDKNHSYLFCDNCQKFSLTKTKENLIISSSEKIQNEKEKGQGVSKEENLLANYKNICKKCGYEKAQILDMGIFYSDEDNLILLKCGKCGFSERVGRKVS